jgi:S-adenosylmethionine decarboxylase
VKIVKSLFPILNIFGMEIMVKRFLKIMLVPLFCINVFLFASQEPDSYEFVGEHLLVNYMNCDSGALNNEKQLRLVMQEAAKDAGATVLTTSDHYFEPNGYSLVLLLSESHATIHTYPEFNSCFVDFFTCGTDCDAKIFKEKLEKYLKPKKTTYKIFFRDDQIKHIAD